MRSNYLGGLRLFYHVRKSSSASLFIRSSTICLTQNRFNFYSSGEPFLPVSELTKAIGQAVNQIRLSGNMSGNGQNATKKGRRRSKSPKSPRKRNSENHGPKPPSPNHRTLGVNYTEYKEMFYIIFLKFFDSDFCTGYWSKWCCMQLIMIHYLGLNLFSPFSYSLSTHGLDLNPKISHIRWHAPFKTNIEPLYVNTV